jgi:hypothetical protein
VFGVEIDIIVNVEHKDGEFRERNVYMICASLQISIGFHEIFVGKVLMPI